MPEDSIFAPDGRSKSTPPRDVTPNVAATTAAALNAERAAQKLKKALLTARKQPLLNTQAAAAVSVPVDFKTPHKTESAIPQASSSSAPVLNLDNISFPSFGLTPPPSTKRWTLPPFTPDVPESPSPSETVHARHRTQSGSKYHQRAVPLKRSPAPVAVGIQAGATSPSPATSFDWGPLPGVKPKTNISFDVRKKD